MRNPEAFSFDITHVIGRVEVDPYGDGPSAHETAFVLVAKQDMRGTFQWPMEDGRTFSLTVDYPDLPGYESDRDDFGNDLSDSRY